MIKIKVPATSANIGSGFDSLGLALGLYNSIEIEESDKLEIYSCDGTFVPKSEDNLIYTTIQRTFLECDKSFKSVKMGQSNPIPMARGLGSSSACIATGIVAANELMGKVMSKDDMLSLACEIEGHPDNVAPAILGGFVASVMEGKRVYTVRRNISDSICFAAFIPAFKLLTERARQALPKEVSHKDAIFNLSRSALVSAAFCEERYELLGVATQDVLHQQYRLPLIPGGEMIIEKSREIGAIASFISGAGPTILAIVPSYSANSFFDKAQEMLLQDENTADFTVQKLLPCNQGIQVL